ncbi:MAG: ArsR family transcriptional regulator [Thermoplasmata archaeon]|nr:MAG: ArsR family transcriptional regulator [Thermoplasmata archaeon]
MESHGLMFELSHPERLKILEMIKENPMRLSHISKSLDVTTAEVSRHLERLVKASLIERDSDNFYNITSFAAIILSEFSKFDFLAHNKDFFLSHDLTLLPIHLHWFNSMAQGTLVEGTLEISSRIKDLSTEAEEYIYVMSNEIMRGLIDVDCKKNDEGVVLKKIYPQDAQIPDEYMERINESFQIRTIENVPLALKINEKTSGMAFKDKSGKVDFSVGLTGDNEAFCRWIKTIFDYYWDKAKPIR